ncbi:MAG: class I tRNA ligase family protein, partial [Bacteroidaceae bacterium]|nr:class I tRNA ligase family protein [Bacteroidaceae bacterium]
RKVWGLFYSRDGQLLVSNSEPSKESLKSINKLIQKVSQDIESFSYNTAISAFMICVGELAQQKCCAKAVLEPLVELLAPFAPHLCEELWEVLGHQTTVCDSPWPEVDEQHLKEDTETLSISFNGKTRFTLDFAPDASKEDIEKAALEAETTARYTEGKQIIKVIVVPHRIVNIVLK